MPGSLYRCESLEPGLGLTDCVVRCASPALAFQQRCMAPEEHALHVPAASLASYVDVLRCAAVAGQRVRPAPADG